ncbi:MAG: SDR family NAD(P)-dependent oxidoreductase [Candidatus Limnocylindrales bacterium]
MTDRIVLITGATGVLGREVARVFAADGARLGLVGTDHDRLASVARDLGLADDRWVPAIGDLRERAGARTAVATVTDRFGDVEVLIHLVGGWTGGSAIADLDPADVAGMLDQHVWTTLHVTQAVVPGMVAAGWGRVLAVSTPVAAEPPGKMGPYAIAKAAEEALLRTLAREVAGDGITVNLVVVKAIDEQGQRATDPKKASSTAPDEIAATFRFLASDAGAAVTGARIPLFGRS